MYVCMYICMYVYMCVCMYQSCRGKSLVTFRGRSHLLRYFMIHVIYSDPTPYIFFCKSTCPSFQTVVEKDRKKQHKLFEE